MRLINETRGEVIAERLRSADTFWKRLRGLLGTRELPAGNALLLRPCNGVHMFGMRYSIDLLFVDERDVVVATVESLAPGQMKSCRRAAYVVELPCGAVQSSGTVAGDRVKVD